MSRNLTLRNVQVYAICEDGLVCYVGATRELTARLYAHAYNRRKASRIHTYTYVVLEVCTGEDAPARERYWITRYPGLTNRRPAGPRGLRERPPESLPTIALPVIRVWKGAKKWDAERCLRALVGRA